MEKVNTILEKIKHKTYRYSAIRESMTDVIIESRQPLSYFDLHALLNQKKIFANKTTIYRELAFLKEQGVIRELKFNDGINYYEPVSKGHHHHIICTTCQTIDRVELEQDLDLQEKLIAKKNKFKVLAHSLEFYGICKSCLKK